MGNILKSEDGRVSIRSEVYLAGNLVIIDNSSDVVECSTLEY